MIFPTVELEAWRKRFNLPVIEAPCAKCGVLFKTTVPILIQGCAGLSTPIHDCGEEFAEMILTPKTDTAQEFWQGVVTNL